MDAISNRAAVKSTLDAPHQRTSMRTPSTVDHSGIARTKTIRTRPDDILDRQDAAPRLPLKEPARYQADHQSRASSKMSLFNLFSKPKVEKLRGHSEPGLAIPRAPSTKSHANLASKSTSNLHSHFVHDQSPRSRPTSSKSHSSKAGAKIISKDHPPPLPTPHKLGHFDQLPLFQAFPQSSKHGTLETALLASNAHLNRPKGAKPGSNQPQIVDVSKKLFVLVSSGRLLQYAHDGPSDRVPQKVLQLGKDSAAFACDLIPGQHYVLQVSQAVDEQGVMVLDSGSLFSRMGIRSSAAKRVASHFLLIFSSAQDMNLWMTAIRQEIEIQGGAKSRSHSVATASEAGEPTKTDLKRNPSQSHRYQIKRDPSKVSLVTSPVMEKLDPFPPMPALKLGFEKDQSETATLDGIEQEASTLESGPASPRDRAPSDAHSIGSSKAQSVGQQQLDKLRDSIATSNTSTANTWMTSRTNSMTSSQPFDQSARVDSDTASNSLPVKSSQRNLQSYTLAKRRSAAPLTLAKIELPENGKLDTMMQPIRGSPLLDSPTYSHLIATDSTLAGAPSSPRKRFSLARSAPDLKARAEARAKHDSKMPSPSAVASYHRREDSTVSDLPPPLSASSKLSPTYRSFNLQSDPPQRDRLNRNAHRLPSVQPLSPTLSSANTSTNPSPKLQSPLKLDTTDGGLANGNQRVSQDAESADVLSPIPVVRTLEAKVNFAKRTTLSPTYIPTRTSSSAGSPNGESPKSSPSRRASARLSLFPSSTPPVPPSTLLDSLHKRSPPPANSATNSCTPRRPTSMQVRTDYTPFLTSVRNSTQGLPVTSARPPIMTPPIRSLKPSRSMATMESSRAHRPSRSFLNIEPADGRLSDEASDQPTPLPERSVSPSLPIMHPPPLPTKSRKSLRVRSSMPDFDMGTSLVSLGPPAPPPKAPLPEIPSVRRSTISPRHTSPIGDHPPVGLGVQISAN